MQTQPNIIVFLTDDHAQWASGCYGARELATPALDNLAQTGVRMTRAFTPSPVCSPARASFWTGRMPSQHGIHDYLQMNDAGKDHPGLSGQITLADRLHEAGYQTALIGKWHCGDERKKPTAFDRWFAQHTKHRYTHRGEAHYVDEDTVVNRDGYQAEVVTEEALQFLRHRDTARPYFLFIGYIDTHSPFSMHPEKWVERYRNCSFDDIAKSPRPEAYSQTIWAPESEGAAHEMRAQYYAAVSHLDEQVGLICDEVEQSSEAANTLTVYTSDHGLMCGQHDLWLKGNVTTPQNFLDESILVPRLLRWPQRIRPGHTLGIRNDHCDLHATILDAAGIAVNNSTREDSDSPGRSFLNFIDGGTPPSNWRSEQYCEYGNARMIRTETAKLIRRYPAKFYCAEDEYYDLIRDPSEVRNLSQEPHLQDSIASLSRQLDEYFDRYSVDSCDGPNVINGPRCNPTEPWLRPLPKVS